MMTRSKTAQAEGESENPMEYAGSARSNLDDIAALEIRMAQSVQT